MPARRHMVLYTSDTARGATVRALWARLCPQGSFVATASLADAALSALQTPASVVLIDGDCQHPWGPLLRHLRRSAPGTPLWVLTHAPEPGAPVLQAWSGLEDRLRALLEDTP